MLEGVRLLGAGSPKVKNDAGVAAGMVFVTDTTPSNNS